MIRAPRRNPFEVFLLFVCLPSGIGLLAGPGTPGSIESLVSPTLTTAWGVVLLVGAVLALGGGMSRASSNAIIIQQVGLGLVGTAAPLYSLAVFVSVGPSATFPGLTTLAFGLACWVRFWQLQKDINDAVHALHRDVS